MQHPPAPFLLQVQVELKKGETVMTDASLHLPAAFLHEAFSDRSGVPPSHFELYYRGKRLEGEAALASYGIGKDATIEVKMRGRGGMLRWQKTENGWKKSEAPPPEQKEPEAPNLAVPVAAEQAASLPEPQVSHASVRFEPRMTHIAPLHCPC